jgi:hypothetical protein
MAHGCRLTCEFEVVLDFPRGWHDPSPALGHFEVIEDFLLAAGKFRLHIFEQCSREQKSISEGTTSEKSDAAQIFTADFGTEPGPKTTSLDRSTGELAIVDFRFPIVEVTGRADASFFQSGNQNQQAAVTHPWVRCRREANRLSPALPDCYVLRHRFGQRVALVGRWVTVV